MSKGELERSTAELKGNLKNIWNYFMISLQERKFLDQAEFEPATFWLPVGRACDWAIMIRQWMHKDPWNSLRLYLCTVTDNTGNRLHI